ncbi:family 16 glycoside hydrolase [Candidatus Poribacteria bacterium]
MLKSKLLMVTLVFLLTVPVYAQVIFQDNFDDPAASEANWEMIAGNWEFKDGMLYSKSAAVRFITTYVAESKWDRDKPNEFDEYTMEFRFMKEAGPECCRPIWRSIADPLPKNDAERAGFYEWNIGGWSNTRSVLRRFDLNGTANYLLDSNIDAGMKIGASVNTGEWYEVKVVIRNNGLTEGYLNGEKSWEIEDNTWTEGRIGIVNYLADMYFDDFRIYGPEGGGMSVEPENHLATTWGNMKTE